MKKSVNHEKFVESKSFTMMYFFSNVIIFYFLELDFFPNFCCLCFYEVSDTIVLLVFDGRSKTFITIYVVIVFSSIFIKLGRPKRTHFQGESFSTNLAKQITQYQIWKSLNPFYSFCFV